MKWIIAVVLSLLLVTVCVVYLRHEKHLVPVPIEIPAPPKVAARPKTVKVLSPKPGPDSPVDISGPGAGPTA